MKDNLLQDRAPQVFWAFVTLHLLCWTLLPTMVNPNLPLDVIEGLTWGHEWQWGYHKHPIIKPWSMEIAAILSGGQDWAQYFLSQLFVVTAFWGVWRLAREFFPKGLALVAVLLLEGVYYHNYTSPEFNVNVAQLPFWALTVFFTWRGLTTGKTRFWVMAGVFTGFGFLSKYVFLFLMASIAVMMVTVKAFRPRLATPGPYIGALAALAVVTPHLLWVLDSGFATIAYGLRSADVGTHSRIYYPLKFLITQPLILIPLFIMLATLKTKGKTAGEFETDRTPEKSRFLLFITLSPFLMMVGVALVFGLRLRSMWGTPLFLFSGVALVCFFSNRLTLVRFHRFLVAVLIFLCLSLTIYWGVAAIGPRFSGRAKRTQFPGRELAAIATQKWQARFDRPADIIIGSFWHAGNIAYYGDNRASVFIDGDLHKSPWITPADIKQKGAIVIGHDRNDAYRLAPGDPDRLVDEGAIRLRPVHPADLPPIDLWMVIVPPAN
jgi:4-amino-4-deoxy-L-arabinose transferase-like glycosyltransferase